MKIVFSLILIIHGLVHVLGFLKAFRFVEISQLSQHISKPIGLFWLLSGILFLLAAKQFMQNNVWFYTTIVAIIISQVLIFLYWRDAKFGSIINLIILFVSLSVLMTVQFNKMVENESKQLLNNINSIDTTYISKKNTENLPEIVQKWMINSGVIGHKDVNSVWLKQIGSMRLKPKSNWMSFSATQYFNVEDPSFIWHSKVNAVPSINFNGRDKFIKGKGTMHIKLAGIFDVVKVSDNNKINSASMIRYLSEICWFPTGALNDYITWASINDNTAKATFTYNNISVSGVFTFLENGELKSFKTQRFFGGDKDAQLETWLVEIDSFKVFNGIKIPNKSRVTWKLKRGDFHWLNVEITAIAYNTKTLIPSGL